MTLKNTLRLDTLTMPAADLGPENPVPSLFKRKEKEVDFSSLPGSLKTDLFFENYGHGNTTLPYTMQNLYNRKRQPRTFKTAVLENRHLCATFLLEMGGRLWSIVDKRTGRELLYKNPVFQPANLGARDAWFSGGVEWNIGTVNHSAQLCEPIFAARLQKADGTPVLRLWDYERIRGVIYQADFWLDDGSPFLRVRFRVHNTRDGYTALFQWSNIAVPETAGTRVLSPAQRCYAYRYDQPLTEQNPYPASEQHSLPRINGRDVTRPLNNPSAKDYYFKIPRTSQPWVAVLDETGRGLIHTSTRNLIGRKFFVWGTSQGCQRWQRYLTEGDNPYLEVQAGLTRTQHECLPMAAGATWEWLEAYGLMEANPRISHGDNWNAATGEVDRRLAQQLPLATLDRELRETRKLADQAPAEMLNTGAGWAALELKLRAATGQKTCWPKGVAFPDSSLGPYQKPWLDFLTTGKIPARKPDEAPASYVAGNTWRQMLEKSIRAGDSGHWYGWFLLGIMCYSEFDDNQRACDAWKKSAAKKKNPWALYCLGALARMQYDFPSAARHLQAALALAPHVYTIASDTLEVLNELNQPKKTLAWLEKLPASVRQQDRIVMAEAFAALKLGDYRRALEIINSREFACVREGEESVTSLWFNAQDLKRAAETGRPVDLQLKLEVRTMRPPAELDFRMSQMTAEQQLKTEETVRAARLKHIARAKARKMPS